MSKQFEMLVELAEKGQPEYLDDFVNKKRSIEHMGGTYTIEDWLKENKVVLEKLKK